MTKTDVPIAQRFADVDASGYAQHLIEFLDRQAADMRSRNPGRVAQLGIRHGDRVLDLGCGPGVWTFEMADAAGPAGCVVGVDYSEAMIAEARLRGTARATPVEFHVGDVRSLGLPDESFDLVTCSLLLLHVDDTDAAIREMVRVTKPGGRIAVYEPDHQMSVIDGTDTVRTEQVIRRFFGELRSPRIGRELRRRFVRAGLTGVHVTPRPFVVTDWASLADRFTTERLAGYGSVDDVGATVADFDALGADDAFFACFVAFDVSGTKPA